MRPSPRIHGPRSARASVGHQGPKNTLQGQKKKILNDLKAKEISLINKIKDLEFKNSLLIDNIDLDYVEILIRERFLLGKN